MKKKDFYSDIKHLHKEIVAEIVALMVEHDVTEVDLAGSSADHAYVIGVPDFDWDIDYIEAEVLKVYYEDGQLVLDVCWDVDTEELAAQNENGDIGDAYTHIKANDFMRINPCAGIDSVYESVWQVLEGNKEPEYVWVFTAEQCYDMQMFDVVVRTFATEKAARKFLYDFIHEDCGDGSIVDMVKEKGWDIDEDEPNHYYAGIEGSYLSNRVECTITECRIES